MRKITKTKLCPVCNTVKDRSAFYTRIGKYKNTKGVVLLYPNRSVSACKSCSNAHRVSYIANMRVNNPAKYSRHLALHSKVNNKHWHKMQAAPEGHARLLEYKRKYRTKLRARLDEEDAAARANPLSNKLFG